MKYKVYHLTVPRSENDSGLSYRPNSSRILEAWNRKLQHLGIGYHPVAYVETTSLENAYRLTNYTDRNWAENEEVTVIFGSRSTSIGDIIVDENGTEYFVDRFGFSLVRGA